MISRLISFFISPYYKFLNFFRSNYRITDIEIKTILVTEYHRIGDVLIISPVLKSLKRKFPKAHLILICNREVGQLASHLNLADEMGLDLVEISPKADPPVCKIIDFGKIGKPF